MPEIYHQRQIKSDLCRLYSLNNYFGYEKLSEHDFYNYCDEYDNIIEGLKSRNMDGFAEGRSIINYIVDKIDKKFTILIPLNNYKNSRKHLDINRYSNLLLKLSCFFEFNKGHIWINKKIDNIWYKIDSISGINKIDPKINNNGYILVIESINLFNEIHYYLTLLQTNKSIESEIIYYNLFHSLKYLNLDIPLNNNIEFNENLTLLKSILKELTNYIELKRSNIYNKHKLDNSNTILVNLIKLFK